MNRVIALLLILISLLGCSNIKKTNTNDFEQDFYSLKSLYDLSNEVDEKFDNKKIDNFNLFDTTGRTIQLDSLLGNNNILILRASLLNCESCTQSTINIINGIYNKEARLNKKVILVLSTTDNNYINNLKIFINQFKPEFPTFYSSNIDAKFGNDEDFIEYPQIIIASKDNIVHSIITPNYSSKNITELYKEIIQEKTSQL